VLTKQANKPVVLIMAVHLAVFFVVAMACHGELAADRPPSARLTEFYFWLALGGVLGGVFNAVVAPLVFASTAEYPLTLVLGCLLVPGLLPTSAADVARDLGFPLALGAMAAVLVSVVPARGPLGSVLVSGVPAFVCFAFSRRPMRFALGVAALFLAGALDTGHTTVLARERSFYGIHRVVVDADASTRLLVHGTTLHGMQAIDGARRREPLAYYHPAGPLGQLFASLAGARRRRAVAVVGLGAGSVACYAEPGQRWDFYEIDPTVTRIARDPRYFTYLADCAPDATITLGDARLSLARATATYDLVILDAYSSDAIPVHLLTREAIALYLAHLRAGGILAFHVSNRHVDLEPVLSDLARDAGLAALIQLEPAVAPEDAARGRVPSRWVAVARAREDLGALVTDPRWHAPRPGRGTPWTDERSSVLAVLRLS